MNWVKFGNYHSFDDLNLILGSKEIEAPSAKTDTTEVPNADGVIDFTEYFGEVKYKNRKIKLDFTANVKPSEFLSLFSSLQNKLHGKKMKIVLSDDADFYYIGRIDLSPWKTDKTIGKLTIECDCEPYKYKTAETVVKQTISGSSTIKCNNLKKTVMPKITTTAKISIGFEGNTYEINAGTVYHPSIILKEGSNTLNITGSSTVTLTYQERGL